MKRAIIESPFRGANHEERLANIKYARACCKDAVQRGYVPFASHLLFPQFLNEDLPEDRDLGINMGYDFWEKSDIVLFYIDRGVSPGMEQALIRAFKQNMPFEKLSIGAQGFQMSEGDLQKLEAELKAIPPAPVPTVEGPVPSTPPAFLTAKK